MNNKDMPAPGANNFEQLTENARWYLAGNPVFENVQPWIMEEMVVKNAEAALAELERRNER